VNARKAHINALNDKLNAIKWKSANEPAAAKTGTIGPNIENIKPTNNNIGPHVDNNLNSVIKTPFSTIPNNAIAPGKNNATTCDVVVIAKTGTPIIMFPVLEPIEFMITNITNPNIKLNATKPKFLNEILNKLNVF